MSSKIVPVVLAGGSGTRLWPLSRKNYPKQFLKLIGNNSLFQETLLRIKQISGVKESIIVTNESHYFICQDQMKEAEIENSKLILEPCSRNTAPAIALAALDIQNSIDPEALMLVLPADHLIGNPEAFAKTMERAAPIAAAGHFVTFGIVPSSPKTGYGYIQAGKPLDSLSFEVKQFVEKPDEEIAEAFLQAQNYFWNSGMFLFRATGYLEELKNTAQDIYDACSAAYQASHQNSDYFRIDQEHFEKCPSDSIDYAVMEKTKRSAVIPLRLPWSDLGCWASVADAGEADDKNNVIRGNVIMKDCEGCLLSSENEPLVATIGIKDQIVVSTADAVLVADKAYAQEVKEIVNGLKNTNQGLATHHKRVHCPWGHFEKLVESSDFQIKLLVLNPGKSLALQSAAITVIRGTTKVQAGEETFQLEANSTKQIPPNSLITNSTSAPIQILETSFSLEENKLSAAAQTLESLLKKQISVG
ncbi:mannose-1-phosphate guanylyltransferase/mannose-6-phosphate isomerase [Simkania sp.]|uniref:mannose-1-phosphate guanylyltransferase/mannose-6-phosphate isomerase n=1 Tax=Simkania sp. TaxID=34094 RepID=UPI003B519FF2